MRANVESGSTTRNAGIWKEAARFLVIGGSCVLLNAAMFAYLERYLGWSYLAVTVLAFAVANITGFFLHRLWTFRATAAPAPAQAIRFLSVQLSSLVLNLFLMWLLIGQAGVHSVLASIVVSLVFAAANFFAQRWWTFRGGRPIS